MLLVVIICIFVVDCHAMSDLYRLEKFLFEEYTKIHRPVRNSWEAVNVSYDMALEQLIEVDVKNEMAKWLLWERAEWYDQYLTWDPANFSGVEEIRLHPRQIWLPDIVVFNSVYNFERNTDTSIPIYVNHRGFVRFYSPEVRTTFCPIDVKYFPYDTQNCSIVVGSWTYLKEMLNIKNDRNKVDLQYFSRNGEWDVYETGAQIQTMTYSEGSFQELHFSIIISRKPLYYEFNLMLPTGMISGIALLDFLLPCESGEKISLAITVLLSLCVNMLFVSNLMPATSLTIPILGKYFIMTIAMVSMSLVLTVGVLNLHHPNSNVSVLPKWAKRIFFDILAPILLLGKYKEYLDEDDTDEGREVNDQIQSEALEKKIFKESNYWNGTNLDNIPDSSSRKHNNSEPSTGMPFRLYTPDKKSKRSSREKMIPSNPFQRRRMTLNNMLYQGMFTATPVVCESLSSNYISENVDDPSSPKSEQEAKEQTLNNRLDRIEDILLYLACRLRNQEMMENVKQEWRFLAEVIDRVLVVAFMVSCLICTYVLISNAKTGGHNAAVKMANELNAALNITPHS
ncbi:neuronal acetylcholine receptor subunit alpha-9-like isoform X2 [Convolutriloba macropyga]